MACLLIGGVVLGVNKIQTHRRTKRDRLAAESASQEREKYFHDSKGAEAEASKARNLERRGSQGSLRSLASWEGEDFGEEGEAPPGYHDVVGVPAGSNPGINGRTAATTSARNDVVHGRPEDVVVVEGEGDVNGKGKGKGKKLWKRAFSSG